MYILNRNVTVGFVDDFIDDILFIIALFVVNKSMRVLLHEYSVQIAVAAAVTAAGAV